MSTHPQSEHEDLQAWLDGELEPARAREIEAAAAADPALAARARELAAVDALLDRHDVVTVSEGFVGRVVAACRADERLSLARVRRSRRFALGAAAAAILVCAFLAWNPFSAPAAEDQPVALEDYYPFVGPAEPDEEIELLVTTIEDVEERFLPLD